MAPQVNKLFLIILIISFLVRIIRLDYPLSYTFAWGDGTRDFLVANHIAAYREFPLLGPYNLLYENGIKGSPVYFFFLALLLLLFNNILALGIVNILLQTILIALIYLIVSNLFDKRTAIAASLLYSFNWEVLRQSDFIWQPYVMLPIIGLSAFLMIQGWEKRSYPRFLWSSFFLAMALCLHNSAFPWVPVFLIIYVIVLKKMRFSIRHQFGVFLMFISSLFIFYLPVFKYYSEHNLEFKFLNVKVDYLANLSANTMQILEALNLNNLLAFIFLGILIYVYFWKVKDKKSKTLVILLILAILPIIFASFFNKIRLHYLILSIPSFTIFISRLITIPKNNNTKIFFSLIFFLIISGNFKFIYNIPSPLMNQKTINNILGIIVDELKTIKKSEDYKNFDFFQIRSFTGDEKIADYPVLDTVLIVPLEKALSKKISKVSDESPFNHVQINGTDYLIITCHKLNTLFVDSDCLRQFTIQYPRYGILKNLYSGFPISVYIAKYE